MMGEVQYYLLTNVGIIVKRSFCWTFVIVQGCNVIAIHLHLHGVHSPENSEKPEEPEKSQEKQM